MTDMPIEPVEPLFESSEAVPEVNGPPLPPRKPGRPRGSTNKNRPQGAKRTATRFIIELYDPAQDFDRLWEQVQEVGRQRIAARVQAAKEQFPDLALRLDETTMATIFRHVCEHYLKEPQP